MAFKTTRYVISIASVDGETGYECSTPDPRIALTFLQKHDHEGAMVELDEMDRSLPLNEAREGAVTHPDEHARGESWRRL